MNLFRKIFRPAEAKNAAAAGIEDKEDRLFYEGVGEVGSRQFTSVAAALRAGFVIAGGMGLLPLKTEGEDKNTSRVLDLINTEPNEFMTLLLDRFSAVCRKALSLVEPFQIGSREC